MPYIAFDLDAKKRVPAAARAAGVDPGVIAWGLLEIWEHVFATKSDLVGELILDGCFGPSPRIRQVLVAYGFLEEHAVGAYRVRGAGRYLRVKKAQSEAGKRAAGNLRRGRGEPENPIVISPGEPEVEPEDSSGFGPALPPSTEHLPPSTKELPPPTSIEAAREKQEEEGWIATVWTGLQHIRRENDLAPEPRQPRKFRAWCAEVLRRGLAPPDIGTGYAAYILDQDFRLKGWPTAVFITDGVWPQRCKLPITNVVYDSLTGVRRVIR